MPVAIMTDTNSGLTVAEGKELGIYVLPMPVIIQDVCHFEGVDITTKQLFYLPMSSGLSGSCHAAIQLSLDYDGKVQVADNHRISVPLVDSLLDAKYLADQSLCAKEIKKRLEADAYQSSIYITVNTLEYLKKSGRVTPAAAAIATVINLKPILTIQGDKLDSYAKVRGIHQSEKRMIEAVKNDIAERFADVPINRLSIGTAGTFEKEEDAKKWYHTVKEAFPEYSVRYNPLSCSIASHVGPNALGISVSLIEEL